MLAIQITRLYPPNCIWKETITTYVAFDSNFNLFWWYGNTLIYFLFWNACSEKHEAKHQPRLHKGPVIKTNANQRYATTAATAMVLRQIAKAHNVPLQVSSLAGVL